MLIHTRHGIIIRGDDLNGRALTVHDDGPPRRSLLRLLAGRFVDREALVCLQILVRPQAVEISHDAAEGGSGCSNGDIGYLYADDDPIGYRIEFDDGRVQHWTTQERSPALTLAYAVTVHKAQGSEYDTVLMPVSTDMRGMLDRNLFYTAISRAKERVVLFGQAEAIDIALKTARPPRRSTLVPRARLYASRTAQEE